MRYLGGKPRTESLYRLFKQPRQNRGKFGVQWIGAIQVHGYAGRRNISSFGNLRLCKPKGVLFLHEQLLCCFAFGL